MLPIDNLTAIAAFESFDPLTGGADVSSGAAQIPSF